MIERLHHRICVVLLACGIKNEHLAEALSELSISAVAAERERCAEIVERCDYLESCKRGSCEPHIAPVDCLAAAIRARATANERG
jgi:hypothetical protein